LQKITADFEKSNKQRILLENEATKNSLATAEKKYAEKQKIIIEDRDALIAEHQVFLPDIECHE
jgi:hypothetical protein